MSFIYHISTLLLFLFIINYLSSNKLLKVFTNPFVFILSCALVSYFITMNLNFEYRNDLNTFIAWGNMIVDDSFKTFYTRPEFTDYPPGYMYVLFILAKLQRLLKLDLDSLITMYKLPACIADVLITFFIYKLARLRFVKRTALLLAAAYLLNPAVLINSAVWGQVDSIPTLISVISIYFLTKKKYYISCVLYGVALLIKPQALFYMPIFIMVAVKLCYSKENIFAIFTIIKAMLCTLAVLFVGMLPFSPGLNFMPVINQYIRTLNSYPYATINAYNFYGFIGGNWQALTGRFLGISYMAYGFSFIVIIIALSLYLIYRNSSKANYFFIAALLNVMFFMFAIKMHERYIYPAMAFLIISYIYSKNRKMLLLYGCISFTLFINCVDVLYSVINDQQSVINSNIVLVSAINLIIGFVMIRTAFSEFSYNQVIDDDQEDIVNSIPVITPLPYDKKHKPHKVIYAKKELIYLCMLTLLYSLFNFYNLGDLHSPQTTFVSTRDDKVVVDFGAQVNINKIQYLNGARNDKNFQVSYSSDGINFTKYSDMQSGAVFYWNEHQVSINSRYLELSNFDTELMLQEMTFRNVDNEILGMDLISIKGKELFDEQHLIPEMSTYLNSTYFDEIYHARTGYEFVNSLSPYEITHPPLGKVIIAAGIQLFGMTPFGFRFMGALFGSLMVPLMYIFAKRVWRSSFWAFFTTIIFTFDFMHFAQTRIATIDTYVTFFIVAAYYFMYMYYETSFYKVSLRRTLSYLFFSGMFFGLATASKWPGLYAGIGLAVLFFYSIYRRYRESLYARDIGDMITVNKFYKYTWSTLLFCLFAFIIVPVGIYVLSYIPMLKAPGQNGIKTILSNQTYMLDYHKNIHQEHPFESKWWQWPLMIRPIFYYVSASSSVAKTGSEIKLGISSFGNPAVWWVGIVAFFMSFKYMSKKYDSILIFFVIGLLSQYLPWSLITRTAFIYHFFPSVPFLVFLITVFFRNNYKKFGCYVYLTVTVLLFILFYPILSAMSVSTDYVNSILKWLPTWNLI